jgi:hypothetical protein
MKNIKQLYTLLYKEIKDLGYIGGICSKIDKLYYNGLITLEEHNLLGSHFKSQKFLHPEFMTLDRNWFGGTYWWSNSEEHNPVNRKAFIKKLSELPLETLRKSLNG